MSAFVSLSRFFTTSGPRPFSLDFPESIDDNSTIVDSDATEVEHSQSAIEHSEIRKRMLSSIQMASPEQLRALVLQLADEIPEVQWSLVRSLDFTKEALSKDSEDSEVLHVDARSDVADSDEACCSSGGVSTDSETTRYSSSSPSDARSSSSWKTARSVNDWDVNMEDVPEIQSEVSVDVRSCPRWDMCVNCGKSFDMNAVRGPFECCYHPGFLQKDVERNKQRDPRSYPEDFIWRCCDESNPEGCETGYHIPAGSIGLPRFSSNDLRL